MPFANVEVAVLEVMLSAVASTPLPKVEVADPRMVVVAVSPTYNLFAEKSDDEAVP